MHYYCPSVVHDKECGRDLCTGGRGCGGERHAPRTDKEGTDVRETAQNARSQQLRGRMELNLGNFIILQSESCNDYFDGYEVKERISLLFGGGIILHLSLQ